MLHGVRARGLSVALSRNECRLRSGGGAGWPQIVITLAICGPCLFASLSSVSASDTFRTSCSLYRERKRKAPTSQRATSLTKDQSNERSPMSAQQSHPGRDAFDCPRPPPVILAGRRRGASNAPLDRDETALTVNFSQPSSFAQGGCCCFPRGVHHVIRPDHSRPAGP